MSSSSLQPAFGGDFFFTSESVSEGHPDKLADQISDAILDACLREDPYSRVACETLLSKELVVIAGEITSKARPNFEAIARQVLRDVGYTSSAVGIDADNCEIKLSISQQAGDIARGVVESDRDETLGAGDQGLMFGFACDETPELMPLPISLAHRILQKLTFLRKSGRVDWLRPDAKSQVTVEYREGRPWAIDTVVLSTQHDESVELVELISFVEQEAILPLLPKELLRRAPKLHINPTGRFVEGGPAADCGLTGRKIIVDSYGGFARHGGGAFSGKDPTKVDRTAAYASRYIAKNLVAAGLARRCEVQVAYAIGVADPVSILVETFGTSRYSSTQLTDAVRSLFQLTPAAIIRSFQMRRPIYRPLAVGGHFGREELNVGWERLDRADELKAYFAGK